MLFHYRFLGSIHHSCLFCSRSTSPTTIVIRSLENKFQALSKKSLKEEELHHCIGFAAGHARFAARLLLQFLWTGITCLWNREKFKQLLGLFSSSLSEEFYTGEVYQKRPIPKLGGEKYLFTFCRVQKYVGDILGLKLCEMQTTIKIKVDCFHRIRF